ncbi:MAG: Farnesyl-diphosphate synthase [Verrucomicrobiales bacterium]|nr:Farnesyl-diphosphate synthase [Verrucomicrobiales bacterium]
MTLPKARIGGRKSRFFQPFSAVPELSLYLTEQTARIDAALERLLPSAGTPPATLHAAIRHSIFAGGKRLRPVLLLAACEACGGDAEQALPAACAVECIHTYSLIHDDLPCMDDDDFRRGRPTCHKVYGEAIAVLAGDALQPMAFELLLQSPAGPGYSAAGMVRELAVTAGSLHLIAGQVRDLEGEGKKISFDELRLVHEGKTAALLTASLRLGAMVAGATPAQLEAVTAFGHALGLAFQVIDDILDVTQTSEKLGKTAGKDAASEKSTYPAILGLEASRAEASRLTDEARAALGHLGPASRRLGEIAGYLLQREF